ncbi:DUF6584 family protein [Pontibacter sp. G13]|uniref:DUF6584 family protein n=1 Tax=Pontibacter sp. G13 TaxID=3074898 RepID=UPI00288A45A9|nr:DUF6584 family protein [Pontibacter sp. G13]WNJ17891.1 hypothetical protein RJD25_23810 [Pontibacter sp. G13]
MTQAELNKRIKKITKKHDPAEALKRLYGYMYGYYGHSDLCTEIGNILIKQGELIKAGKYIFFKEHLTEQDLNILANYYQSFGNESINILRDLIGSVYRSPKYVSLAGKERMLFMLNELKQQNGHLPKFTLNWYRHFSK